MIRKRSYSGTMIPLTSRHCTIFLLAFVGLLAWVWIDHLLPSVGGGLPVFDGRMPPVLGYGKGGKHKGETNTTKPRFYSSQESEVLSGVTNMTKPLNVDKILGLVFFGRRETVSVLDCYLKRNLVKNGGMLDGVIFLERTQDQADLAFMDRLIESEPAYERWKVEEGDGYSTAYEMIDDDNMYIKMDDDIVYIEDTVIPSMVHTKIRRPDYYVVSANVVNQPLISWIHWNLGAVKPYLPEMDREYPNPSNGSRLDWRPSTLPAWTGPEDFDANNWASDAKHRWLPVRGKHSFVLDKTPIEQTEYDAFGRGWWSWQIGAQEHYSLLENLEKNEMWRYKFHTWDFQYARMGIQFIAMMGRDINAAKPMPSDDEHHFSVTMPMKLGRHAVADGRGIAAHYSFGSQREMKTTDVLDRYRAFANEHICTAHMLWESEADDPPTVEKEPELESQSESDKEPDSTSESPAAEALGDFSRPSPDPEWELFIQYTGVRDDLEPESTAESVAESTEEPTAQSTAEPSVEATSEPVADSTSAENSAEDTAETATQSAAEQTAKPTAEPKSESELDELMEFGNIQHDGLSKSSVS